MSASSIDHSCLFFLKSILYSKHEGQCEVFHQKCKQIFHSRSTDTLKESRLYFLASKYIKGQHAGQPDRFRIYILLITFVEGCIKIK